MEQMSDEEIARIKAKAEQGKGGKEFEYKGKYEDYKKLLDTQRNLEAQKRQLEEQNKIALETMEPDETGLAEQIRIINEQIEDNARLQNLFQEKEAAPGFLMRGEWGAENTYQAPTDDEDDAATVAGVLTCTLHWFCQQRDVVQVRTARAAVTGG